MGGWAIAMTGVLVVGSLADVAVRFMLLVFGLDGLAADDLFVMIIAIGLILLMTWICVVGTELSGRVQTALNIAQVIAILIFASAAIYKGASGQGLPGAQSPTWEWLNPFAAGAAGLSAGLLLGVFAYWGWESAVNLNEETTDSSSTPGKAAILSTLILLATYLGTAIAVLMLVGPGFLADRAGQEEMVFALIAPEALGSFGWIVLLAVVGVGNRFDADHDHSGITNSPIDVAACGHPEVLRPNLGQASNPGSFHLVGRDHCNRLVRGGSAHQ